jgi:TonB family protein
LAAASATRGAGAVSRRNRKEQVEMPLVVSIARDEPLCIKASADVAAGWAGSEKGYGFRDRGATAYPGGGSIEIALNFAVRPNSLSGEFAQFPAELECSGELTDDASPVGVFMLKGGRATVAIMVPGLLAEMETNPDEAIELDRVVLATRPNAHLRLIVSIKLCSAVASGADKISGEAPLLAQAEVAVTVHGTAQTSSLSGADLRTAETFTEQTTTAIIFSRGTIVRLAQSVAPGQILILRNLASNEEAACRVASVKANPAMKAFVELEFLQPAPNFWGDALVAGNGSKQSPIAVDRNVGAAPKAAAHFPAAAHTAPPTDATKSTSPPAPRKVFSRMAEMPSAVTDAFFREKPQIAEPEPEIPAPPAIVAESAPAAAEPAAAVEPVPRVIEIKPIEAELAPIASLSWPEPEHTHDAPLPAEREALPAAAERVIAATELTAPELASAPTRAPALESPAALNPIRSQDAVTPTVPASVKKTKAPAIPIGKPKTAPAATSESTSSSEEILSGGKSYEWSKGSGRKKSRSGALAAAAVILAAIAGAGFYAWQTRYKQSANVAAAAEPALMPAPPTASDASAAINPPITGTTPAARTSSTAPAAASSPRTSLSPATAPKTPATASAAPAAPYGGAKAPAKPAYNMPAQRPPSGPGVAGTKIQAPTSAAAPHATNQQTPAIAASIPSVADGTGASGIFGEAQSGGPAAPPPTPAQASTGAQAPRLLYAPTPIYPDAARSARVQGDVTVDLQISDTGRIVGMAILSGPPLLRDAAFEALRQRKYAPALVDGKPTSAHVTVVIHFQL